VKQGSHSYRCSSSIEQWKSFLSFFPPSPPPPYQLGQQAALDQDAIFEVMAKASIDAIVDARFRDAEPGFGPFFFPSFFS